MKTAKLVAMLLLSIVASFAQSPTASAQSPTASVQSSTASVQSTTASTSSPADSAFSHFSVLIEGGEIYPFGDVQDAVDNALFGGFGIKYSYWENVDGFVTFNYSYFDPIPQGTFVFGVHQFTGRLGLDWRWSKIRPLAIGAGFTCNWTRADYDESRVNSGSFKNDLGGTLTDNETEFGWFARLNLPCWHKGLFSAGLDVLWEQLWTLPERSNMLTVGVYLERRIW